MSLADKKLILDLRESAQIFLETSEEHYQNDDDVIELMATFAYSEIRQRQIPSA